jgi:hypothetical protein
VKIVLILSAIVVGFILGFGTCSVFGALSLKKLEGEYENELALARTRVDVAERRWGEIVETTGRRIAEDEARKNGPPKA